MIHNVLESDPPPQPTPATPSATNCIDGLDAQPPSASTPSCSESLMLVTALNRHIGYDNAAKVAKKAYEEGTTLVEAVVALGMMTEDEFKAAVVPEEMVGPRKA